MPIFDLVYISDLYGKLQIISSSLRSGLFGNWSYLPLICETAIFDFF